MAQPRDIERFFSQMGRCSLGRGNEGEEEGSYYCEDDAEWQPLGESLGSGYLV
jgi:hypothetical protein